MNVSNNMNMQIGKIGKMYGVFTNWNWYVFSSLEAAQSHLSWSGNRNGIFNGPGTGSIDFFENKYKCGISVVSNGDSVVFLEKSKKGIYKVVTNTAFVGYMLIWDTIWDTGYFTLLVE